MVSREPVDWTTPHCHVLSPYFLTWIAATRCSATVTDLPSAVLQLTVWFSNAAESRSKKILYYDRYTRHNNYTYHGGIRNIVWWILAHCPASYTQIWDRARSQLALGAEIQRRVVFPVPGHSWHALQANNKLGPEGTKYLASALGKMTGLQVLDLVSCSWWWPESAQWREILGIVTLIRKVSGWGRHCHWLILSILSRLPP